MTRRKSSHVSSPSAFGAALRASSRVNFKRPPGAVTGSAKPYLDAENYRRKSLAESKTCKSFRVSVEVYQSVNVTVRPRTLTYWAHPNRALRIRLRWHRRLCVFERCTEASKAAVFCAQFEASLVGSPIIDTEHLLLGLLRVDPSTMQAVAEPLSLDSVRKAATRWHEPRTRTSTSCDLPLGPEAKQSMLSAALIADSYSSSTIRSEHHLMALIYLTGAHAALILEEAGASRRRLCEARKDLEAWYFLFSGRALPCRQAT